MRVKLIERRGALIRVAESHLIELRKTTDMSDGHGSIVFLAPSIVDVTPHGIKLSAERSRIVIESLIDELKSLSEPVI